MCCFSKSAFYLLQFIAVAVFAGVVFVVGGYVGKYIQYESDNEWHGSMEGMVFSMNFWRIDVVWILWRFISLSTTIIMFLFINWILLCLGRGIHWMVCTGCLGCMFCCQTGGEKGYVDEAEYVPERTVHHHHHHHRPQPRQYHSHLKMSDFPSVPTEPIPSVTVPRTKSTAMRPFRYRAT